MSSTYYYKVILTITLNSETIFDGFFVVNNHAYPNIIGFYENPNDTINILAPVKSFDNNDNVFNTLINPFQLNGVNITYMSYYDGDYGSNTNPPYDGGETYNLYNFLNGSGKIGNFDNNVYQFTTVLANPEDPIPLYPPAPRPLPPIPPAPTPPTPVPIIPIICQESPLKSRFCYSYKPPGLIEPTCKPVVCATDQYLSSIAMIPAVTNNSTRTTESSLLQAMVKKQQQTIEQQTTNSTIQSTITNAAAINENVFSQLINLKNQRYMPYQPYIYPVVPPSVMELQMRTANVGVGVTPDTIMNCRGSQFVTT